MIKSPYNILVILGPTASGKTALACQIAHEIKGEIISADSRQVYKKMDIGTGKDLDEYKVKGIQIPYHLIDIKAPGYKYNIAEFQTDFIKAFNTVSANGNFPILCGGSGLYLETALSGNSFLGIPTNEQLWQDLKNVSEQNLEERYHAINPTVKKRLNAKTKQRKIRAIEISEFLKKNPNWKGTELPQLKPLIIGIDIDRELRRQKITKRLSERLNNGLIEEVQSLLQEGLNYEDLAYYGLEYKWLSDFLKGEISKRELFEGLNIAIHQFAKKQMTWFRRMEKQGYKIEWLDATNSLALKCDFVIKHLTK